MCLPYNIIFTNDSFHNIKGYFRPLSLFLSPLRGSAFSPYLVAGVSLNSTPACGLFTPSGFPLAHPAMSQGLHFIPPLPLFFPPLRGFLLRIPLCRRGYISFHPCLWSFHPFGVSTYAPTHRCGNRKPRRGGKITGRGAAQRNPCGTDIPTPF